jgi:hypothetical protein
MRDTLAERIRALPCPWHTNVTAAAQLAAEAEAQWQQERERLQNIIRSMRADDWLIMSHAGQVRECDKPEYVAVTEALTKGSEQ